MSDQLPLLKKLKKLAAALAIAQRRSFTVDLTTDTRFADLKAAIEKKESLQGRSLRVGYHAGDYNLCYFIFGQDAEKPETGGEIDFNEAFIDAALEYALVEAKKVITNNVINELVQKKLEEVGLD